MCLGDSSDGLLITAQITFVDSLILCVLNMSGVKIKVISRNPDVYLRATKRDIHKCKLCVQMITE